MDSPNLSDGQRWRVSWSRVFGEGLVIVVSILLAFSVDAWWDGLRDRQRERELLTDLLSDFETSRPELAVRLDGARRMARGNLALRDAVAKSGAMQRVSIADSLILSVISGPTYEPATNTLDAALASGQIDAIRSDAIQAELANWSRLLVDTREDELLVREITTDQVVPLLAEQVELSTFYDRMLPWFFGEGAGSASTHTEVQASSALVGLLSQRGFYMDFAASDLAAMSASLDRLIELIASELK